MDMIESNEDFAYNWPIDFMIDNTKIEIVRLNNKIEIDDLIWLSLRFDCGCNSMALFWSKIRLLMKVKDHKQGGSSLSTERTFLGPLVGLG